MPGQYTGRRRPQPELHVCVANLSDEVRVLSSLERPVRVTVRDYHYLATSVSSSSSHCSTAR